MYHANVLEGFYFLFDYEVHACVYMCVCVYNIPWPQVLPEDTSVIYITSKYRVSLRGQAQVTFLWTKLLEMGLDIGLRIQGSV